MFVARRLQRHCLRTLSSPLQPDSFKNIVLLKDCVPRPVTCNAVETSTSFENSLSSIHFPNKPFCLHYRPMSTSKGYRPMSTSKGRSMRSKVESRMRRESGKTLREIRRSKKIAKKLMTDEERLIYNLKRAKKKVALLLQKLKKYELPELPTSVHDPELFTPEQIQAYKKIGFRNKNYVPVGVRGVFGGVVQNMHMHWKFHETVQVCCDNFPKEKIKEMATMLARLSGGIVINLHNVKTIIMFRGRNYRQPKNLIPINTLTKRKALFKARFEQALESQKLNIKKIEQELRRKGISPEDPAAMASIQRVASTFFNAIDEKAGSPYVFRDNQSAAEPKMNLKQPEPSGDSDQEELDKFIAEIEDAADREWAEEEAVEKEELGRIRYWNREDIGGRSRRFETTRNRFSDDEDRGPRSWKDVHPKRNKMSDDDDRDSSKHVAMSNPELDSDSDIDDDPEEIADGHRYGSGKGRQNKTSKFNNRSRFNRCAEIDSRRTMAREDSEADMLNELDETMDVSDEELDYRGSQVPMHEFRSSSDEEDDSNYSYDTTNRRSATGGTQKSGQSSYLDRNASSRDRNSRAGDTFDDSGITSDGSGRDEEDYHQSEGYNDNFVKTQLKTPKEADENWDSD